MSVGVDEKLWFRAKDLAADAGHEDNYPYIMSIYKNLKEGTRDNPSLHSRSKHSNLPPLSGGKAFSSSCPLLDPEAGIPMWYLGQEPPREPSIPFESVLTRRVVYSELLTEVSYVYFLTHAIMVDLAFIFRKVQALEKKHRNRGAHLTPQQRTISFIQHVDRHKTPTGVWDAWDQGDAWLIFENVSFGKLDKYFEDLRNITNFLAGRPPGPKGTPGSQMLKGYFALQSSKVPSEYKRSQLTWNMFADLKTHFSLFDDYALAAKNTREGTGKHRCILSHPEEMGKDFWWCVQLGYEFLGYIADLDDSANPYIFGRSRTDATFLNFVDPFINSYTAWRDWVFSHDARGRPLP